MADPVFEALNRAALECTPEDIDIQIAYLRKAKLQLDSGVKPKKEGADIDLRAVLKVTPKVSDDFDRRF